MNGLSTYFLYILWILIHDCRKCAETRDTIHNVTWKSAEHFEYSTSDPLCINTGKEITTRECVWNHQTQDHELTPSIEETDCSTKQVRSPNDIEYCPENYELIDNIVCITYIPNTTYPIACEFGEPSPFAGYKNYISNEHLPVWMPVIRDVSEDYGYGWLYWRESSRYYEIYNQRSDEIEYAFENGIKNKGCLVFYNDSYTEAVECSNRYTAVCAYQLLSSMKSYCSQIDPSCNPGVQSDFSRHSKCFCLSRGNNTFGVAHLAEFIKPYQNHLYEKLTQEPCYFGLAKTNEAVLWNTTKSELSYTMWSEDTDFLNGHYGFISESGVWKLVENGPSTNDDCIIYQIDLREVAAEIKISFDEIIQIRASPANIWLKNSVTPLIYCFTDCSVNKMINILDGIDWTEENDAFIGTTNAHVRGPGNYWCQGFTFTNQLINSNKLLVRNATNIYLAEYVILLEFDYDPSENPLTYEFTNYNLYNPIRQLFLDTGKTVRIFAVNDLDEEAHKMNVTFHLTSTSFTGSVEEYNELYTEVVEKIEEIDTHNATLIELFSTDKCFEELTNINGLYLTWPETQSYQASDPIGGHCFDQQDIVKRECQGSFVRGVKWTTIQSCTFFNETETSRLLSDSSDPSLEMLIEILQGDINALEPVDIYFIERSLENISKKKSSMNIRLLVNFLDLLLLVPADIMKTANEMFSTSNNILKTVHEMVKDVNSYAIVVGDNVLFYSSIVGYSNNTGILIHEKNITILYDIEDMIDFEYAVIWTNLSDAPEVLQNSQIIFLGFFRNNLFTDLGDESLSQLTHITFTGVQQGDFEIVYNVDPQLVIWEIGCSGWGSENMEWQNLDCVNTASRMYCKIDAVSSVYQYYSFMSVNNDNLTAALERLLLDSEGEPGNKLDRLYSLSNFSDEYIPVDVILTSEILDVYKQVTNIEIFFKIVNNLMNVNKTVMKLAQTENQATDKILHSIEDVSMSSDNDIDVEDTENMKVVTLNLRDNNDIFGVLLNGSQLTICQEGVDDLERILVEENFDIFVEFSKRMIMSVNKIALTIYFNDALFNEQKDDKQTSKIIGISSSTDLRFSQAITIYYNTKRTSGDTCGYWNFNSTAASVWRSVPEFIENSSVVICMYHQFSHYALLRYNITSHLEDILASNKSMGEKLEELENETANPNNLSAEDIELIAKIFGSFLKENTSDIVKVSHVVNNIMNGRSDIMQTAQLNYGSTDRLLYYIDQMAIKANDFDPVFNTSLFKVVMIKPSTGISGLLLSNCRFTCDVVFIYKKLDPEELVSIENLNAGIIFDQNLLNQLKDKKIIITIFLDNLLFNSEKTWNTTNIFGILIPDFNSAFDGPISLFYNVEDSNNSCGFWEYKVEDQTVEKKGQWNDNLSSKSSMKNLTICDFDHVTHFALLLDNNPSKYNKTIYRLLDLITLINCILSAFGIFSIIATALLFEKWRRNTGNKILLNFSISLSLKVMLLYVSEKVYDNDLETDAICTIIGAVLHYALLSEFCWMMIIAILQFKRFVEVLGGRPKYILLKACICGWAFPLVPVGLVLSLNWKSYTQTHAGLCYPTGLALYLAVWLPIIVIFIINLIIFTYIIFNVCHKKTEYRETSSNETLFQWRLALLLFFMLGLTWSFGLLGQIDEGLFIFVYLFCFTASLQGFIMFLFFIVFNKSTRLMYAQGFRSWKDSANFKVY